MQGGILMGSDSNLSARQMEILSFIRARINSHGYPPSVREIGEAVGLKSSSTVHAHLVQLEEKGYLRKDPSTPRAIIPIDLERPEAPAVTSLPVVGKVAAGTPILAEQNIENYLPVPDDFLVSGTHFILQVSGESMIDAGILNGDYVIVRQQPDAADGEIVVALIEDEATVKRLYKKNGYVELHPENSAMEPIVTTQVQIAGKVTGLLRRF
jgi:repressor LexA